MLDTHIKLSTHQMIGPEGEESHIGPLRNEWSLNMTLTILTFELTFKIELDPNFIIQYLFQVNYILIILLNRLGENLPRKNHVDE